MSYSIEEIKIGQKESFSKTITETDVYLFAGISGDLNPAHIDEEACKKTKFEKRIAHGMLVGSLISTVFGMKFPGPGTIYLENQCRYKKPVFINDTITAEVEVIEILSEKGFVRFATKCVNQDGLVVQEGTALVMPPKKG